jgi:C-terminal processing protease CtpA/Prc
MLNRIAAALILGIALPDACTAQVQEPRTASCPADRASPYLGIGIHCDACEIRGHRDGNGPAILFPAPPLIDEVHRGSVAEGVLQAGDVLLAIDGVPIVGRAGGYAFDAIRPHVPARLTIQRDGQRRDVVLVPGLHCYVPDEDEDEDEDEDDDEEEEEDPR